MSSRDVGSWSSPVWGSCWKLQATAAVRMAVSKSVGSRWLRRARSMALCYWDQACLSCSGVFSGKLVSLGPHPPGEWGGVFGMVRQMCRGLWPVGPIQRGPYRAFAQIMAGGGGLRLVGEVRELACRQVNKPLHFDGVADCVVLGCGLLSSVCRGGCGVHVADDNFGASMAIWQYASAKAWRKGSVASPKRMWVLMTLSCPASRRLPGRSASLDADVVDEVDVDARLGVQEGPLMSVAFFCPLAGAYMGVGSGGSSR